MTARKFAALDALPALLLNVCWWIISQLTLVFVRKYGHPHAYHYVRNHANLVFDAGQVLIGKLRWCWWHHVRAWGRLGWSFCISLYISSKSLMCASTLTHRESDWRVHFTIEGIIKIHQDRWDMFSTYVFPPAWGLEDWCRAHWCPHLCFGARIQVSQTSYTVATWPDGSKPHHSALWVGTLELRGDTWPGERSVTGSIHPSQLMILSFFFVQIRSWEVKTC